MYLFFWMYLMSISWPSPLAFHILLLRFVNIFWPTLLPRNFKSFKKTTLLMTKLFRGLTVVFNYWHFHIHRRLTLIIIFFGVFAKKMDTKLVLLKAWKSYTENSLGLLFLCAFHSSHITKIIFFKNWKICYLLSCFFYRHSRTNEDQKLTKSQS